MMNWSYIEISVAQNYKAQQLIFLYQSQPYLQLMMIWYIGKSDSCDGVLPVNDSGTVLTSSETFLLALAAPLHLDEGFFPASFGTEIDISCDTFTPFFVLHTHNK